jgi:hypothetical protein
MPTGLDAHPIRDAHPRSAASCQPNDLQELKEPCRHPRSRSNKRGQPLGKDFSWASGRIAENFPNRELKVDRLPSAGVIGQSALIATMNTCRCRATQGARRTRLRRKQRDVQPSFLL